MRRRRDPTSITTKTYTTAKNAVVWLRKSTAKIWLAWFLTNVFHVWPPRGSRLRTKYLRIVLVECRTPSLTANSSAILSSPHCGFSALIRRIRAMWSSGILGRPGPRDRQRQYSRAACRCQEITVAGLTTTNAELHPAQSLDKATQKDRSSGLSWGRFRPLAYVASCCLRARFSSTSEWRLLRVARTAQITMKRKNRTIGRF